MAHDLLKSLFIAKIAGDVAGNRVAAELSRQAETGREREASEEQLKRTAQWQEEHLKYESQEAEKERTQAESHRQKQLLSALDEIGKSIQRQAASADDPEPRYYRNQIPPAHLYSEYLQMGDELMRTNFCLPPYWVNRIQTVQMGTRAFEGIQSCWNLACLFVCPEPEVLREIEKLLSSMAQEKQIQLVSRGPMTEADLAGAFRNVEEHSCLMLLFDGTQSDFNVLRNCTTAFQKRWCCDLEIGRSPDSHFVRLMLPDFRLCVVTSAVGRRTSDIADAFPNKFIVTNLVRVFEAAKIGHLCKQSGFSAPCLVAQQMRFLAEHLNYDPCAFTELLLSNHRNWIDDLSSESNSLDEWVKRFEKEYGAS
jgi:hypothetical protein